MFAVSHVEALVSYGYDFVLIDVSQEIKGKKSVTLIRPFLSWGDMKGEWPTSNTSKLSLQNRWSKWGKNAISPILLPSKWCSIWRSDKCLFYSQENPSKPDAVTSSLKKHLQQLHALRQQAWQPGMLLCPPSLHWGQEHLAAAPGLPHHFRQWQELRSHQKSREPALQTKRTIHYYFFLNTIFILFHTCQQIQ